MEFFYCPYCGDENLHPADDTAWECRACLCTFIVTLTAIRRPFPRVRPAS